MSARAPARQPAPKEATSIARRLLAIGLLTTLMLGTAAVPSAARGHVQFPILSLGSRGADVLALQHLLRHGGATIRATAYFDAPTRAALSDAQADHGLQPDGIARPQLWLALVPRLEAGASGEAVLALKAQLNAKRSAGLGNDPSFDDATADALRTFQRHAGLRPTGVADEATWRRLVGSFMKLDPEEAVCGYALHDGASRHWATAAAVAHISAAAELFHASTGQRLAVGDMSTERGGPVSGHRTHQLGLDVDLRAARRDGRGCRYGIAHTMRSYDRQLTRQLIAAIHAAAPGQVKLIYFNDPVLVREGLTVRYPNHDAHLHVRYCTADHPARQYRCAPDPSLEQRAASDPLVGRAGQTGAGRAFTIALSGRPPALLSPTAAQATVQPAGRPADWFGRCLTARCTWAR